MLLSQRPLSPAEVDGPLALASRAALTVTIGRNARRHRNTLVLGARGSGRSSLLSRLEARLRGEGLRVARLDVEACDEVQDLVAASSAALGDDPRIPPTRQVSWQERWAMDSMAERTVTVPQAMNETHVSGLVAAAQRFVSGGPAAVVLLDNLHPTPAHDLFGRYRDTVWAAPVVWVAAGDGDREGYLSPPADVFWESVEWLEPLDADEVGEMLVRRIEAAAAGDGDAATIAARLSELTAMLAGATPREVLRAAAEVVEQGGTDTVVRGAERFAIAHRAGGRRAAMLLAEMERIGRPMHAGDNELGTRMGLTRPRLVQLLNTLAQSGLLERHREGRKILFRVAQ